MEVALASTTCYYQFIMKSEGMKNYDVRIMHAQQALSHVSYTQGFSMENLQLDSKHLVAMNSLSSNMILSPIQLVINLGCSTFFSSCRTRPELRFQFPFPVHLFKTLPLRVCWIYCMSNTHWLCHGDLLECKERFLEKQNCKIQAPK
jgi:hypothetical protein